MLMRLLEKGTVMAECARREVDGLLCFGLSQTSAVGCLLCKFDAAQSSVYLYPMDYCARLLTKALPPSACIACSMTSLSCDHKQAQEFPRRYFSDAALLCLSRTVIEHVLRLRMSRSLTRSVDSTTQLRPNPIARDQYGGSRRFRLSPC